MTSSPQPDACQESSENTPVSPDAPAAETDLRRIIADLQAKIAINERIAEEHKAAAEAASRAKIEFFANVSHELRTPLNTIIGYSEMLQEEHCDAGEKCLLLDLRKIHAAGRQLLVLIDDILDIPRMEAGKSGKESGEADASDVAIAPSGETLETVENTLAAISKVAVKPILAKLAAYLADGDGKAADYFEAQRSYFESALTADYFTRLDKLLYDFKFHEALSLLESSISDGAASFEFNEKHTVLIVDDVQENLTQMSALLKGGFNTKTASNAADALRIAASDPMPDLILLDIMMPEVDGYEVCRWLKAKEKTSDIPVIFLTAKNEIEDERLGFEIGAVDYLTKPISLPIALARMKTHLQIKASRDLLKEKALRQTELNHLVAHLMAQMMHSPGLRDDHVRYWINPSELVSGDLVAAARNRHDILFVMLADSTGHGLPAALNLLPVNRIFYRMVEKGFPIQAIIEEMNRTIIRQSPPDRFVAAVVACIDGTNRIIELWNGGIPSVVFCDCAGVVKRIFPPTSFPLGIAIDGFPARTQVYRWENDGQLVMFSDGLLEAEDNLGTPFGFDRVLATLSASEEGERFDNLVGLLHRHLGERSAHDDVSLLITRCAFEQPETPMQKCRADDQAANPIHSTTFTQRTTPMKHDDLFTPIQMGAVSLNNRIVMAPLTRNRADADNAPQAINVEYYRQRATAGLIISEGSQISPSAVGYPATPGIYSPAQIAGWKRVTDAVHERGGKIFLQLWHCGRVSHPSLQPNGELPVAPSAVQPAGQVYTYQGLQPFVTPRALETAELPGVVEDYRKAAQNAVAAGFDGVEIHAANGYLLDQFLRDGSNRRSDAYGGSPENRCRLLLEVTEAVAGAVGAGRVGVRLSPINAFNDMSDAAPQQTFEHVATALNRFGLACLHVMEVNFDAAKPQPDFDFKQLRRRFEGRYIANGGYDKARANAALAAGDADLVAFGVPFIANPDLVARMMQDAPLNAPDPATFYGGGEKGYTDYPFLA